MEYLQTELRSLQVDIERPCYSQHLRILKFWHATFTVHPSPQTDSTPLPMHPACHWSFSAFFLSHIPTCIRAVALPTPQSLSNPHLSTRDVVSNALRSTWRNPTDTLDILLIIGGDIVHQALAQLSGRTLTPVAFSFGWVSYSFNTLRSIVGDGRLMPPPDYSAKIINADNGYSRTNRSWVLGRLLRDFEYPLPDDIGLSVTVFEALPMKDLAGVPSVDWHWISGIFVIVVQLIIAAIPCKVSDDRDWSILLITAAGIALSLLTGMLPQWRLEKWVCRRNSKKVVSLTGGNGKRHVMVIIGKGYGLDLEDLAVAETPRMRTRGRPMSMIKGLPTAFWITQVACSILALLWVIFLITVTALEQDAWYLLAVGTIGMVQNVIVAGARREMSTTGVHLKKIEVIEQLKVMDTLMDLEVAYKGVGKSLLKEFFPNDMRPAEDLWWSGNRVDYDKERGEKRPESMLKRYPILTTVSLARDEHNGVAAKPPAPNPQRS
ncbi:hypothetical protein K435DRAFT_464847 [Dendrothele bispora CBS 962.96]|uniref:Uncharacterized protein n=1 Tax=Dendrothele bispora (strain CBS 962.96) TaxID=1314807 RepID=A0A4S8L1X3_DENBC|nr:hypothetical protein K435DRAFT_464847 [Dendrothele bispora CBS 962.96]